MDGRRYVITGATAGIGRVTAVELARRGGEVILANRTEARTRPVMDEIAAAGGRSVFVPLDLASLASVREAAKTILARGEPIHVLINNAGVAGARGETADGFELAFGTNHLGHFLLTDLLMPRLKESAPARVVTVASKAHYRAPRLDLDAMRGKTRTLTGWPEYSASKLANVLFSSELGRRTAGTGVTAYSLHPGVVASDLWREVPFFVRPFLKMFMVSNEEGARTTLHCATSPDVAGESGLYYDQCRPRRTSRVAQDEALAKELWRRSEAWVSGS